MDLKVFHQTVTKNDSGGFLAIPAGHDAGVFSALIAPGTGHGAPSAVFLPQLSGVLASLGTHRTHRSGFVIRSFQNTIDAERKTQREKCRNYRDQ